MTKTAKRREITKRFCEYIIENYPNYDIEDGEGGRISIINLKDKNEFYQFMRSDFYVCGWGKETEFEKHLNKYLEKLVKEVGL